MEVLAARSSDAFQAVSSPELAVSECPMPSVYLEVLDSTRRFLSKADHIAELQER